MKKLQSEKGYTLVTVLLIIAVFLMVFLSFIGQSFSSVKQNQLLENASQSVAVAEMGVTYYRIEIQRYFEERQDAIEGEIKLLLGPEASIDDIKEKTTEVLAIELIEMFSELQTEIYVNDHENTRFKMTNFNATAEPDPNQYEVKVTFNIDGIEDNKETELLVELSVNLETITSNIVVDQGSYQLPILFNNIPKPNAECKTLDCDIVFIDGNGHFSGNNNLKDNQTVYTTGSLTFDSNGNENNLSKTNIHADGFIKIGKNMNNASNIIIETNNNADFMQNLKMNSDSTLHVKNTLTVTNNFELSKSNVYVGNGADIGNHLDLSSSSTMCVNGNLTAKKIKVKDSKLIVSGIVKEDGVLTEDFSVNEEQFKAKCGVPELTINWGDTTNTVINNVKYN